MTNTLSSLPFHQMRQLMQEHTALWQKLLPELTKPQYSVLSAVAEQPGIEQVTLNDAALMTKATLAEMLVRMEKRGVLVRKQSDRDRRRRFIFLTDEGERTLEKARPVAESIDRTFLAALSAEEQEKLSGILKAMLSAKQ